MPKKSSASPLIDIYIKVGRACLALWPLFLVQLVFTLLQYATFLLCLGLLFEPFLEKNMDLLLEGLKQPESFNWKPLLQEASVYFLDPHWIVIAVGLALLFMIWWCLLAAVANGGIFRACWGHFRSAKVFSLKDFFQDGFRWLVPMLWLQILLMFLVLMILALWGCLGLLAWAVTVLLGSSTGVNVLASVMVGFPFLLFWMAFALVFPAYGFLCKGLLTKGMGAWESIQVAVRKFTEKDCRAGSGLIVAFLIYVVASFVARGTFGVMGMIPWIGLAFSVLDFFIGIGLMIFVMIYLPALSVAFLSEKDV